MPARSSISRPSAAARLRAGGRRFVLVLAFAALGAGAAAAQSPEQRAELERFRDSLAATSDTIGLLGLERQLIAKAKVDRNDALLHLKLGFIALRIGELGGNAHFDDAASEFQWAIDLQPTWPWAWYGMGLAEYGVGDSQVSFVTGLKTMLGKDALTRSASAFARSAEVDPEFVRGLVELANTALRQRVNIKLDVALDALRRAGRLPAGKDPEVLLARGRVEREVGDADSALAAFRGYLLTGHNRSLGLLELARTDFVRGGFEGVEPYFEAAASDDSATVALIRSDLEIIASDSVLRELDARRGKDRAEYLRRFWTERDRRDLRADGERLREHYRRLFYARRNFKLVSRNRHYDIVERFRSGSTDFDDRGIIYIRHGEPTDRASYNAPGLDPNESWRYARADGDLVFHFIAREDVQDYKLVESLFDVLGFANTVQLQTADAATADATAEQLMLSREQLSPIYRRLQNAGRGSTARYQTEERRAGKASIAIGTSSDSYELRFAEPLKLRSQVLGVGRDSSGSQVQIAYAIAGSDLEPVAVTRGFLYSVRLRFVATDQAGRVAASLDTVRHFVAPAPVPASEHLVGRVAVPLPAGTYQYRLSVQQGEGAGVVLPRDTVRVIGGGGTLALSDLVLGSRSANLAWRPTPDDTVYMNPLKTYRADEEMHLFYEIDGLPPYSPYTTQLAVRKKGSGGGLFKKIFGGGGADISLKFEEQATLPSARANRTIRLDRLKPGLYVMEVTVTDGEGRKDRRTAEFQIVER